MRLNAGCLLSLDSHTGGATRDAALICKPNKDPIGSWIKRHGSHPFHKHAEAVGGVGGHVGREIAAGGRQADSGGGVGLTQGDGQGEIDAARIRALTVMGPVAPTFKLATTKTPELPMPPAGPGKCVMPSLVGTATRATMSGTGVAEADSKSVFNPTVLEAGPVLVQSKLIGTSVGGMSAVGVRLNVNVCDCPAATSTGVLGAPVRALVLGAVV